MPFWSHFVPLSNKKTATNMFLYSHLLFLCTIEICYSIFSLFYLSACIFFISIRNPRVVGRDKFK